MKNKKDNDLGLRFLALTLTMPIICSLAIALSSCRYMPEGNPGRTLFVGSDQLTDPYVETSNNEVQTTASIDETSNYADSATAKPDSTEATAPVTEETTEYVEVVTYEYDVIKLSEDLAKVGSLTSRKIIRYPKLTGLSNKTMQDKINSLLGSIAAQEFQTRLTGLDDYTKNGVSVTYEITDSSVTYLGGNLLCVRSVGEVRYSDGSQSDNFVYSNAINLSTGRDISRKKLYSDFAAVISAFEAGKFKQISGQQNITATLPLADMISQYQQYELYNTYPATYFTPSSLVIVIELNRVSGGYAEFSLPLSEADAFLAISPTK